MLAIKNAKIVTNIPSHIPLHLVWTLRKSFLQDETEQLLVQPKN